MFQLEIARMRGLLDSLVVILDAIENDQVNGSATFLVTELRKSIDKLEQLLSRKA